MANPGFDASAPAPTRAEVEEKFILARGVIGALDRALRTRRMYQPDHSIYIENTEEVLTRMIEFFNRFSYLRLEITPTELDIEGKMVIQAPARPTELPFRLYKDGIREIRFHRGLTREELLDFIGIMELTADELDEMSEDYVSLLWSKDFKSIDYLAVDEFELAEGESPVGLDPETTKTAQEVARRIGDVLRRITGREFDEGAGERRAAYRMGIDEASLAFPATTLGSEDDMGVLGSIEPIRREPEAPPEPAEGPPISEAQFDALFLTSLQDAVAALRGEVENETIGGAIRRSVDILMRLHADSGRAAVIEIGPLLRGVVDFYVRKGDFGSIGHLMSHLQDTGFLERWPGGRALWDLMVETIRRPELKKPLLGYLNRLYTPDDTGLRRYFKIIGPSMVRIACQIYGLVQNTRGRGALHDYLVEFGVAEPQAFRDLVATAGEKFLAEVFDIVREVRPAGVALDLESYLRNPSATIRKQALAIAGRGEGPLRLRHLVGGLADADPAVRLHALRLIGETKDGALRIPLQEWIERGDFVNRDLAEKEQAMRALAHVGGPAAYVYLKAIAVRAPGVFKKDKAVETRRAAVTGLRELGTIEAFEFLRSASEGRDEQLAQFAREALAPAAKGGTP